MGDDGLKSRKKVPSESNISSRNHSLVQIQGDSINMDQWNSEFGKGEKGVKDQDEKKEEGYDFGAQWEPDHRNSRDPNNVGELKLQ